MFTPYEWYLLVSWCYPLLSSLTHIRLNKNRVKDEIFHIDGVQSYEKLSVNTIRQNAPVYVGGPHALIPVGGGISSEWEKVYTSFRGKSGVYWNYDYWNFAKNRPLLNTTYVSNEASLTKVIPVEEHGRFPVSYPMKIEVANLNNARIFFHRSTGLVSLDKRELLRHILIKTRPFGTLSFPIVATTIFLGSWAVYKMEQSYFTYLHKGDPTPTDFIRKILGK
jgi:hypothetical protein